MDFLVDSKNFNWFFLALKKLSSDKTDGTTNLSENILHLHRFKILDILNPRETQLEPRRKGLEIYSIFWVIIPKSQGPTTQARYKLPVRGVLPIFLTTVPWVTYTGVTCRILQIRVTRFLNAFSQHAPPTPIHATFQELRWLKGSFSIPRASSCCINWKKRVFCWEGRGRGLTGDQGEHGVPRSPSAGAKMPRAMDCT